MPCGWEGNHRPGVALAMHHRHNCFIHLQDHCLNRERSTPPMLSCGVWHIYRLGNTIDAARSIVSVSVGHTGEPFKNG